MIRPFPSFRKGLSFYGKRGIKVPLRWRGCPNPSWTPERAVAPVNRTTALSAPIPSWIFLKSHILFSSKLKAPHSLVIFTIRSIWKHILTLDVTVCLCAVIKIQFIFSYTNLWLVFCLFTKTRFRFVDPIGNRMEEQNWICHQTVWRECLMSPSPGKVLRRRLSIPQESVSTVQEGWSPSNPSSHRFLDPLWESH